VFEDVLMDGGVLEWNDKARVGDGLEGEEVSGGDNGGGVAKDLVGFCLVGVTGEEDK
jgi:hypothetical protein